MNANQIAFGIEFETTLPNSDATPIGPYHGGYQVAWLPEGWRAERDGSIRTTLDRKPCEFVSPKLRGSEGLAQVEQAIDAINARGAKVNETCRKYGISDATYYKWKSAYGGMDASQLRQLKELQAENAKLKKMYAELALMHNALQDVVAKEL